MEDPKIKLTLSSALTCWESHIDEHEWKDQTAILDQITAARQWLDVMFSNRPSATFSDDHMRLLLTMIYLHSGKGRLTRYEFKHRFNRLLKEVTQFVDEVLGGKL